jgi:thiosulfate dehydrogenase (quinone) large subunit
MKKVSVVWLVLFQWGLASEWLHSGWGKWASSGFIDNIGKTLAGFAAKTPYTSYGAFLQNTAVPNAAVFGNLIRTGEVAVGLALALGGLLLLGKKRLPQSLSVVVALACFGAALMNINFFLASGWSSPSTWGLNLLMAVLEIILGVFYLSNQSELKN